MKPPFDTPAMDFLLNNKEDYNILRAIVNNIQEPAGRVSSGIRELSHRLQVVPKRLAPKLRALEYRWLIRRQMNKGREEVVFRATEQGKEMVQVIEYFKRRSTQEKPLKSNF